jgi:hypothetical protein
MRFNDLIATVGRLFECIEGVNSSVQQSAGGAPKKIDPSPPLSASKPSRKADRKLNVPSKLLAWIKIALVLKML